jgi:Fe-S-cluster-containing hydrogenase component 2
MSKLSHLLNNAVLELQPQTFGMTCEFAHVASKLQSSIEPVVLMPAVRHHRQWDHCSSNPCYEVCVQGALEHVVSGKYTSL